MAMYGICLKENSASNDVYWKDEVCMEWINAEEKLPKEGIRILFVCKDLKKVLMGHHIRNGLMQFSPTINGQPSNDNSPIIIDMTHWMPLPSPPE